MYTHHDEILLEVKQVIMHTPLKLKILPTKQIRYGCAKKTGVKFDIGGGNCLACEEIDHRIPKLNLRNENTHHARICDRKAELVNEIKTESLMVIKLKHMEGSKAELVNGI